MKKAILAICDSETGYIRRLMEYMTNERRIPMEVFGFDDPERLWEFLEDHRVDLLVISERLADTLPSEKQVRLTLLLSEGDVSREHLNYASIFKYQPCDRLTSGILDYYAGQNPGRGRIPFQKEVEVIGVYSPVGRCGKTTFALTMGQILSERYRTLYISLESHPAIAALGQEHYSADITDLMYFIRQDQGTLDYKLQAMAARIGTLDYLPPAKNFSDLRAVTSEQWKILIREMVQGGGYERIVLDIGDAVAEPVELLMQCTTVYIPVLEDAISQEKLRLWDTQLQETDYCEQMPRIRNVFLPYTELSRTGKGMLQQLVYGPMGKFVRELLGETAYYEG